MQKIPSRTSTEHDTCAEDYDSLSHKLENHTHELIFGLVYEYTHKEDKLLDLGIGTGLSSSLFHKAGLTIYGLDNSQKMLNICREKNIAHDIKLFDLKEEILPYNDIIFDHVVAVGLFHFFKGLENFFIEVHRILKPGGTFSFTVKDSDILISCELNKEYHMKIYGHSEEYVKKLIKKHDFKLLKRLKFQAFKDLSKKEVSYFKIYVLEK